MPFLPFQRIWEIAYFDRTIRASVALELSASCLIPAHDEEGRFGCRFFYYASFGPPPAPVKKLWPPSWWVWIDAETGAITELEDREPKDFGLAGPRDQPFATHAWPKEWTV